MAYQMILTNANMIVHLSDGHRAMVLANDINRMSDDE